MSAQEVFRVFADNIDRLRSLLAAIVEELPRERTLPVQHRARRAARRAGPAVTAGPR